MAASVAWVFRFSLAGWIRLSSGGADWGPVLSPTAEWLSAGWHLVPLGIVPVYLWACVRRQPPSQSAVVAAVVSLALATGVGIIAATLGILGSNA